MKSVFSIGVALSLSIMSYLVGQDAPQDRIEKLEKRIESLSEELKVRGGDVDRIAEKIPPLERKIEDIGPVKEQLNRQALRHDDYVVRQSKLVDVLRRKVETVTSEQMKTLPVGSIVSTAGGLDSLPDNWALCDGRMVNGIKTPDLRSRFLRGADTDYDPITNPMGGNDEIPKHFHELDTDCKAINITTGLDDNPPTADNTLWAMAKSNVVNNLWVPAWPAGVGKIKHRHLDGQGTVVGTTKWNGPADNRPKFYSVYFIMRIK